MPKPGWTSITLPDKLLVELNKIKPESTPDSTFIQTLLEKILSGKKDPSVINLKPELVKSLEAIQDEELNNYIGEMDFEKYVNGLLEAVVKKYEFNKKYFPGLAIDELASKSILIREGKRSVRVKSEEGVLICEADNSRECVHVRFALASVRAPKI